MSVPSAVLASLANSVQPLVFETGIPEYPYSTAGTVFLVGYEGHPFVITTRHSLTPDNLNPVCVFPSDVSLRMLPLKDVFYVPETHESEDFVDLAVISVDTSRVNHSEVAQAKLIDLALAGDEWLPFVDSAEFFMLGFPRDHAFVDFEREELHTERMALHARYIGPSALPHLHEIQISGRHTLTTFSGFSGAPVFAWVAHNAQPARPILCGMAIRGTADSGRVHFLDRSVLLDALRVKRSLSDAE